jgi:hypothetical protein
MIRHVVLLRFKPETAPHTVREIEQAFAALKHTLPLVQDLEWGPNTSPEGLDKGYTHCFFVTFANAADRDAYLPHPLHQAFVERLKPWLADVLVIDYAV